MTDASFKTITDTIFAHDIFRDIDTDALIRRHDPTPAILAANAAAQPALPAMPVGDGAIFSLPPEGVTITKPGLYVMGADVTWAPNAGSHAAITIAADNVVLDMSGYKLSATIDDNSQHLVGILVKPGCEGVSVVGGTLVNMGYYGIQAEGVAGLTLQDITVSGLVYTNLNKRGLCPAGIFVGDAMGVTIIDCTVQYIYATADTCAGIQLVGTIGAAVSGCRVNHLTNYDGVVVGYFYAGSTDIATSECHAGNCQSHFGGNIRAGGHTVLGFMPVFCIGLSFDNCSANNIIGSADDCHGMSVFLVAEVKVKNFTATNVTDGVTPTHTGAKATGVEVYGIDVLVEDCAAENITAINPQDRQATGFSAWGADIAFKRCTVKNVAVVDAAGKESASLGYGTGFGWAPDPRLTEGAYNVEYANCSASDCQVAFDTWYHVNSVWTDISYSNCDIDILVQPGATRTLSAIPSSECNPPVVVTLTNIESGNQYPGV